MVSVHTGTPAAVTVNTWKEVVASEPVPGADMFASAVICKGPVPLPYTIPFVVNVPTPVPPY